MRGQLPKAMVKFYVYHCLEGVILILNGGLNGIGEGTVSTSMANFTYGGEFYICYPINQYPAGYFTLFIRSEFLSGQNYSLGLTDSVILNYCLMDWD